jgi:hypothetical protein
LIVDPAQEVDLCFNDPGFDIDLYVNTDLRTMTAVWMGMDNVSSALKAGALKLSGSRQLSKTMQIWLGLSPFAGIERQVS